MPVTVCGRRGGAGDKSNRWPNDLPTPAWPVPQSLLGGIGLDFSVVDPRGDAERDPHVRGQVRPTWYWLALLSPAIAGDLRGEASPEANRGHVGVLKGDFPRSWVPGYDLLNGTQPNPRPSCAAHHEEAAEHARRAAQAADERETGGAIADRQEVWRPVWLRECHSKPIVTEGSVRVGQQTLELRIFGGGTSATVSEIPPADADLAVRRSEVLTGPGPADALDVLRVAAARLGTAA
jgi:hypothetical protein